MIPKAGPALQQIIANAAAKGLNVTVAKARTAVARKGWRPTHKYNAQRAERDGFKFPSKAEAEYYDHLMEEQAAGRVAFFLMQTAFRLPGGVRYLVDFTVFYTDGGVDFIDVKGMQTASFRMKRRQVESLYPVKIRITKARQRGGRTYFEYPEEKQE